MENQNKTDDRQAAIDDMWNTYSKKGVVEFRARDDQSILQDALSQDGAPEIVDWTDGADVGDGPTAVLVWSDEAKQHRLIALASKEVMLGTGGNALARESAYTSIVAKAIKLARKGDTQSVMFRGVSNYLAGRMSLKLFNDYAPRVVASLRKRGLAGITKDTLRDSLSNAGTAKLLFAQVSPEQWGIIFQGFYRHADAEGLSKTLMQHWEATRDSMAAGETSFVGLSLDDLIADEEAE